MTKFKLIGGFAFRSVMLLIPFIAAVVLFTDYAPRPIAFLAAVGSEALFLAAFSFGWMVRKVLRDRKTNA